MLEKIKDKIKNKNPFRRDKITDNQIVEKQINKESSMDYQGKKRLNYDEVNEALSEIKGKKKNFIPLIESLQKLLNNLKEFSTEETSFELNSNEFLSLKQKVYHSHNKEVKQIIELMEKEKEPTEVELLSKQVLEIKDILNRLENEDIKEQGKNLSDIATSTDKIDNISEIINKKFWDKLKRSIQMPKLDLSLITQKIDSIKNELKQNKNDINNSNQALSRKIENIKFPTPQKIPNDYLKKGDFEFTINNELKDLKEIKESSENLETVPAKVNSIEKELKALSEKMDNLPSLNSSKIDQDIPKEEKSVIDLAKYMTDGVAQFENIAKEYVSKISELEKLDKIKEEHKKELEKVKEEELRKGKEAGKVELIKNLAENFPTEFKDIKSTFEDLLEEKFKKDETLEITDDNKNGFLPFIENSIENSKYKVLSPAILLDGELLSKAVVEKIDESSKED